ncbi:MAG: hypothetical protein ACE5HH_05795 [Candidatus Hydrothermarchaeales archaeon]
MAKIPNDLFKTLVKKFRKRNISKAINKSLEKILFKHEKSMFGVDPWLNTKGLRDEDD